MMKTKFFMFTVLTCLTAVFCTRDLRADSPPSAPASNSLQCTQGPVTKNYGGTSWLVYSCIDERSLVMTASPDNPASPFYFIIFPQGAGYKFYGEGTGDKKFTQAAHDELTRLKESDILALVQETKGRP